MRKSYKTELKPNNKQETILLKHCGAAKYAYEDERKNQINISSFLRKCIEKRFNELKEKGK